MTHSEAHPDDIRHHIKSYILVYVSLLALTCLTVGVAYFHLAVHYAVIIALAIAAVKGSLVALVFMHLNNEKKAIYWILIVTAIVFVGFVIPALMQVEFNHYLAGLFA